MDIIRKYIHAISPFSFIVVRHRYAEINEHTSFYYYYYIPFIWIFKRISFHMNLTVTAHNFLTLDSRWKFHIIYE